MHGKGISTSRAVQLQEATVKGEPVFRARVGVEDRALLDIRGRIGIVIAYEYQDGIEKQRAWAMTLQ